jgi:hypothetical protein
MPTGKAFIRSGNKLVRIKLTPAALYALSNIIGLLDCTPTDGDDEPEG